MASLLGICWLAYLVAFVRALPTISPSTSLSTRPFSLGPAGMTFSMTSNGSSSASHAQTTYGGPFTSSPPWMKGPPKGPWRLPLKNHGPYVPPGQSSSYVCTEASSLAGFGPGIILSSISGQPPYSSHARATSAFNGNNGLSIMLGASAGSLSSSGIYESPYPTSTGLPATSAQILGSGNGLSLMAGQTIVMITLAHDRHGPGSTSLPAKAATIATSSLAFSSAGVLLASETATVNTYPPTLSSATTIADSATATIAASSLTFSSANTISASAASNTNNCGVVQPFYGQVRTFRRNSFLFGIEICVLRNFSGAEGPFYSRDLSYNSFSCIE